ncbi:MAG: ribosome silencing factor [Planctomycetota bacterium]|nr:MAG: ribosome silencing factor [Planctomycetota bacterium]
MTSALRHAVLAAKACDEFRGKDVTIMDLTGITAIFDYFVIATASSGRQMHALAEEVDRVLSEQGSRRMSVEGYNSGNWILQDFGDIVLHVFNEEARNMYDLEHLWGDAKRIDWKPLAAELDSAATV